MSTTEYVKVMTTPMLSEALRDAGQLRVFGLRNLAAKLNVTPEQAAEKIKEMRQLKLVVPSGISDQAYRVTTEGYEIIEQLG